MKTQKHRVLAVGVTGGIGSGKSEVSKMFGEFGATVLSADGLAREIMEGNRSVKKRLVNALGGKAYTPDGRLNRLWTAKIIFSDPAARSAVNAIVHPYVLREIRRIIRKERSGARPRVLIIEAALLYESGADSLLDFVVVVDANTQKRLRRTMERDGASKENVLMRMSAQMPAEQNMRRGDFVIENNGNLRSLRKNVHFLYNLFLKIIGPGGNG